jgi:hypothetical protein
MENQRMTTPFLRQACVPEIEGDRLRLHVARQVFGTHPDRGNSWLTLSPSDDAGSQEYEAQVYLPLDQFEALDEACKAFNAVMDWKEREAARRRSKTPRKSPQSAVTATI